MTRTVLVTGGAGVIGSHLVDALLAAGDYRVRVLDDLSTGKRENLAQCADHVELLVGDVRDPRLVAEAVAGAWGVVHLAAVASVARSLEEPVLVNEINVGGTVTLLAAAAAAHVERLVFASSCAVYGDPRELPVGESTPVAPLSPYAAGKRAGEHYCRVLGVAGGIAATSLRFFNVYGPRQDPGSEYSGVISRFASAALSGSSCVVYGDGLQSRDFVYVADLAQACVRALERAPGKGEAVNVGTGSQTTLLELIAALGAALGTELAVEHAPRRDGDIRESQADVGLAQALFGYAPQTGLDQGLAQTLAWYGAQG
jgi:UDP-glucose 4-epimerase